MSRLSTQDPKSVVTLVLFSAATLCSASLLFIVQPLVGKLILPYFGGGPAIWTACMLFFQTTLLAGYLGAHLLANHFSLRYQVILYGLLLTAAALTLPIHIAVTQPSPFDSPALQTLWVATLSVGAPFLVLSMASPLLQSWLAQSHLSGAKNPYALYIASNIGSLAALFLYPLVIEPLWPVSSQQSGWSVTTVIFAILAIACGAAAFRFRTLTDDSPSPIPTADTTPHKWRQRLIWTALAFAPSTLMLSTTHHLTSNIAPVPLLWTIPLALYLLTFIIAFSRFSNPVGRISAALVAPLAALVCWLVWTERPQPMGWIIVVHLTLLFTAAMACHNRLWISRPTPSRLTEFYVFLSIGGALGGLLNTLLAPMIFQELTEYPLGIALCCLLGALTISHPIGSTARFRLPKIVIHTVIFLLLPTAAALGSLALPLIPSIHNKGDRELIFADRTFFGMYRVQKKPSGSGFWHELWHGRTLHGMQYDQSPWSLDPTTYYYRTGPAGDIFQALTSRPKPLKTAALVGLGAGTLATYSTPGTTFTFFELDPLIIEIAQNPTLFTYLQSAKGTIDVTPGDARITLQSTPDAHFDLVLLDAFGSDAIPVHLITVEAIQLYLQKLAPGGLIAFHTTNWYLDLEPVLAAAAQQLGLVSLARRDFATLTDEEIRLAKYKSGWATLAKNPDDFGSLEEDPRWTVLISRENFRVWTDDYSDLFEVFRWE